MDYSLVSQIIFANESAFYGIRNIEECMAIRRVCKAANENQNIIDAISKNRANLYAKRIRRGLLLNISQKNEIAKETSSVAEICAKESETFRSYLAEYVLLDYIDIIGHKIRSNNGMRKIYYDNRFIRSFIFYNYQIIIKTLRIDFTENVLIALKLRKIEEYKESYEKGIYQLWRIDNILNTHRDELCYQ